MMPHKVTLSRLLHVLYPLATLDNWHSCYICWEKGLWKLPEMADGKEWGREKVWLALRDVDLQMLTVNVMASGVAQSKMKIAPTVQPRHFGYLLVLAAKCVLAGSWNTSPEAVSLSWLWRVGICQSFWRSSLCVSMLRSLYMATSMIPYRYDLVVGPSPYHYGLMVGPPPRVWWLGLPLGSDGWASP